MADLKINGVVATDAQRADLRDNLNLEGLRGYHIFDDLIGLVFTSGGQCGQSGLSTASANNGNIGSPDSESNAYGIVRLQSTAAANDRATIGYLGNNSLLFAGANMKLTMRCRVPSAQTAGVDEFVCALGFHDVPATPQFAVDGAYFLFEPATANWRCVTRNNSSETNTNTTVAVPANTWQTFEIEFTDGGTPTIVYRINGTTVATHTTNIPTARHFTILFTASKSVGTASVQMLDIDAMRFTMVRATPLPNF